MFSFIATGSFRAARLVLAVGGLFLALPVAGGAGASAPRMIDAGQYASDATAQTVWQPMAGSLPVTRAEVAGHKALRLPCQFTGAKTERASWDRKVKLNLNDARGLQFQLFCGDASPISYFSFYFQSGGGWYQKTFFPETTGQWTTIAVDKAEMRPEGNPAGWGQIETIRVSAWRGRDVDTEFFIRDLRATGVLGVDVSVAILRADSVAQQRPDEGRGLRQAADAMFQNFHAAGVGCVTLSDLEASEEQLKQAKLIVLPHNPTLPERVETALLHYLASGGKLLAFYTLPSRLRAAVNLPSSRHVKASPAGQFSAVRFMDGMLPGAPVEVRQQSWNINSMQPVASASRVLAEWYDDQGRPAGQPAVIASTNCIFMTHILLPGDPVNKQKMLLAMASALSPEVAREAAETALANIGDVASFRSYEDAAKQIGKLSRGNAEAVQALKSAEKLRAAAKKLVARKDFVGARSQAVLAHEKVYEAFCRAQQPLPGEFRAFWCHDASGVRGLSWDEAVRRLADNGFNAILPNMLWGGVAYYDSKVLPAAASVSSDGDQIRECLAACRKYGVQLHVWKVNWNLSGRSPKDFAERMRQEGRLQMSSTGREEPWLCPSHPANQKLEVDSMVEIVRNYNVDGIHFDYIRYPDNDHCFCPGCHERFQKACGVTLAHWPQDVLRDGPQRQQWLDWRRSNINTVVRQVSEQARAIKPKIKLSAAVFRIWPVDRDGVGQDWKLWCDQGWLDFVCPMDYTAINQQFEGMLTQQIEWAGKVPCYPGLGPSAWDSRKGADRVIEQINIARQHKTGGFVIFNYGVRESEDLLPKLGMGITKKR